MLKGIQRILSLAKKLNSSSIDGVPDWIVVIILGIIEGITEFLPISSTGHLLLAQRWLPRQSDLFNVVIQSGAVLAVLPLFPDRLRQFCCFWRERRAWDFVAKVSLAFFITGAGGYLLEKNGFALPEAAEPIIGALLAGGILFLVVERYAGSRPMSSEITWIMAVFVGIGQLAAAVFPGASRSGTTILTALILGANRPAATEFSFLVGIPTILAASAYKIGKATAAGAEKSAPPEDWWLVGLGFLVSAVVSFLVVKWFLAYVQTHTFHLFGWYRIGLSLVWILFVL